MQLFANKNSLRKSFWHFLNSAIKVKYFIEKSFVKILRTRWLFKCWENKFPMKRSVRISNPGLVIEMWLAQHIKLQMQNDATSSLQNSALSGPLLSDFSGHVLLSRQTLCRAMWPAYSLFGQVLASKTRKGKYESGSKSWRVWVV